MDQSLYPPAFDSHTPKALILDVDGVLTNNHIVLNGSGEELKPFFVPDGTGIKLLQKLGLQVALVSGRSSLPVHARAEELGIEHYLTGVAQKLPVVEELLQTWNLSPKNAVYVGDDFIDIPPMGVVGLPVAVNNAHPEVKNVACAVTGSRGGEGAVREVCEWIIHARGQWQESIARYIQ